jgi:predicted ATP-grasp superfamily ATP-dependent carboligase
MARGKKTGGREKGTPNKVTGELKTMILDALDGAGGVEYLKARALDTPGPFLALVGKVLPLQVTGEDGKSLPVAVSFQIVQAPNSENQT